jgi:WD40 repeat protein
MQAETDRRQLIQAARFSPLGKKLITGSLDGRLEEWDAESGSRLRVLLDPKGIEDSNPEVFRIENGARFEPSFELVRLSEDMRGSSIMAIGYYPDGLRFVVAAANGMVVAWSAEDGAGAAHAWRAHDTAVVAVEVSPDGKWLATGGSETGTTTLRVWRVSGSWTSPPTEAFSSDRMIGGVFSLGFSPDSRYLATGGWGFSGYSAPMIYDVLTGERIFTLPWDASRAIRYSPDGKLLATGDEFGKVSLWDLEKRARIFEQKAHGSIVSVVNFSPDGRFLVSGSGDRVLKIWDVATGNLREEHPYDGMILTCRFFSASAVLSVAEAAKGADRPGIHHLAAPKD